MIEFKPITLADKSLITASGCTDKVIYIFMWLSSSTSTFVITVSALSKDFITVFAKLSIVSLDTNSLPLSFSNKIPSFP